MSRRARVAVIGGGCGGVTAAYELSRPEHAGRFEVTLFQEGWRLGGKGASGRGPAGRIEEHGLHIWLGYYENSFRMIRDCYAELAERGYGDEFGDWRKAFTPEPHIGLFASDGPRGWQRWTGNFPPKAGLPGDPIGPTDPPTVAGYLAGALAMLVTLLADVDVNRRQAMAHTEGTPDQLLEAIATIMRRGVFASAVVLCEGLALLQAAIVSVPSARATPVLRLAERLGANLRRWTEDRLLSDDPQRHVWEVVDVVVACIVGSFRHRLFTDPRGFDAINDYDCRDWLRINGASEQALDSPFVRGLYDLAFAYVDGEQPAFEAGTALRGGLRMFFGYRGAPFWRMSAGMGDVVFAPLYRLLEARGVRFEFFHRLTNIGIAGDGPVGPEARSHVASLEFDIQARTLGGKAYAPLVQVAGRPCWPSQPDWAQLESGAALAARRVDFERHGQSRRVGTRRLAVGKDFDFVVLAVSLGAVPYVAREFLARDRRWREMVENVPTVATQAFQVWLSEDLEQLGWRGPPYIVSAFDKPFDTWCDMAHVVPAEGWSRPPATAVYFCSVLPQAQAAPCDAAKSAEHVRASAEDFLSGRAGRLWPGALDSDGNFRWELLVDAAADERPAKSGAAPAGPERLRTQYWRANVNPSDRYVLAAPGSSRFRISPLDFTYDNLTLAGDWTECGVNMGCTEAAVVSGRLAAHALSGRPKLEEIVGYDHP